LEPRTLVIDTFSDDAIIARFFKFCHEFNWGTAKPITLKPLPSGLAQFLTTISKPSSSQSTPSMSAMPSPGEETVPVANPDEPAASSMWDPSTNESDRKALMPVLTPISPFMNSTFNVLVSTHRVLVDEFRRAYDITNSPKYDPSNLCESALPELGYNYGLILPIKLSVKGSPDDAEMKRLLFVWKSLIESKIRVLIFHLERVPGVICRPFPLPLQNGDKLSFQFSIGISLVPPEDDAEESEKPVFDLNYAVAQFHRALVSTLETRQDKDLLKQYCSLEIAL